MGKENVYQEYGYEDREDYLINLADDHGVNFDMVVELAEMLGESEDFDGLVSAVEDLETY